MRSEPRNLCVIPARSGSRRIPGKNMREFHGKPIIWYSIEAAKASELFEEIVVSTDSQETIAYAQAQGVTGEGRWANLCADDIGTQAVGESHLHLCRLGFHNVCVLYATAPLMAVEDLKAGLRMLKDFPTLEFVYATGEIDGKTVHAGQFYWSRAVSLIGRLELDVAPTGHIHIPPSRLCDINTEEDWQRAERMYLDLQGQRL